MNKNNYVIKFFFLFILFFSFSWNVKAQIYSLTDVEFRGRWINWIDPIKYKFNVSEFFVEVQIHQNIYDYDNDFVNQVDEATNRWNNVTGSYFNISFLKK